VFCIAVVIVPSTNKLFTKKPSSENYRCHKSAQAGPCDYYYYYYYITNVDVQGCIIMHKTLQGHLTNTKQSCVNSDAAQVLASLPKDVLKSTVLSRRRKAASDCSSLTKDGREFQAQTAATYAHSQCRYCYNLQCNQETCCMYQPPHN